MFVPYLNFAGQCADAFAAYADIFGGTLETSRFSDIPPGSGAPELPAEQQGWLMHARLETPDGAVLMGSDAPPQFADPTEPDPAVPGRGKPFFAGPRPPLRLSGSEKIGDQAIRLTYAAD